jgi:predicted CoA-binding protein
VDEAEILRRFRKIAVVGLSSDPGQASYGVAKYLQEHGYKVTPVNPNETEVMGRKAYADLSSLPEAPEVVQIFRRPEFVPEIVEQAIEVGANVIWMQEGIVHEEAAARARKAGLEVVMDRCMRSVHRRMSANA